MNLLRDDYHFRRFRLHQLDLQLNYHRLHHQRCQLLSIFAYAFYHVLMFQFFSLLPVSVSQLHLVIEMRKLFLQCTADAHFEIHEWRERERKIKGIRKSSKRMNQIFIRKTSTMLNLAKIE